jgi:hypothetical protein
VTHRNLGYAEKPLTPETKDPVARALLIALGLLLLLDTVMLAYIFVFVRRLIAALSGLGG